MTRTLLVWLFAARVAAAQSVTPACPGGPEPAEDCASVCITCNFNGYAGSTAGWAPGSVPGFCSDVQNDQWIGFIAGSNNAVFTATPSNCLDGNGIQLALFHACGEQALVCAGGNAGNGNFPVSIVAALVPGNEYFLMIDGYSADQCDFTLSVSPASAVQAPLVGAVGAVTGPTTVCTGTSAIYSLPAVTGAGAYIWTAPPGTLINGQLSPVTLRAPEGRAAELTFGGQDGTICVQALNACHAGDTVCLAVNIVTDSVSVTATGDTLTCTSPAGVITATTPATMPAFAWTGPNGFGSNLMAPMVSLPGSYIVTVTDGSTGCLAVDTAEVIDQIVLFGVTAVGDTLRCTDSTLMLHVITTASVPTFLWAGPDGFSSTQPNPSVVAAGSYTVTVTNAINNCTVVRTVIVSTDTLAPLVTVMGGILNCTQPPLQGSSPTAGATFAWTGPGNPAPTPTPSVTLPGIYTVVVTAPNGCTNMASAEVVQGPILDLTNIQVTPDVDGQGVGAISITVTGSNDYTVVWYFNGQVFALTQNLTNLTAGTYIAEVTSVDGCQTTVAIVVDGVVATTEPTVADGWEVWPNPAASHLEVRFRGDGHPDARLGLLDLLGRPVAQGSMTDGVTVRLEMGHLPTGLYQLLIRDREQTRTRAVIIQR